MGFFLLLFRIEQIKARQIGADDAGDLGVAANGLAIGQQHDGLAVGRHLDGAGRHPVGHDIGAALEVLKLRAGQPQAHAVVGRRHDKSGAEKGFTRGRAEVVQLRAGHHANRAAGVKQRPGGTPIPLQIARKNRAGQPAARRQRLPQAGAGVGGAAAEHLRCADSARHREVGGAPRAPDLQHIAIEQRDRRPRRHGPAFARG